MFKHLLLTALTLAILPASQSLADTFPKQSRAFTSRPLTFVQHSPDICANGCERKYQFCVNVVNENALDNQIRTLGMDQCERNYQRCLKDCS
jgi:hypothetical protein